MAYQVKNRFLILGLTGPLGAGCSTTAQFLSGSSLDSQITMKESLNLQTAKLKDIDRKIKAEYQKLYAYKDDARVRISKKLGPYKKDWIDPNKDERVKANEQKINRVSSKLKIYLNRREILKTLDSFLNSNSFNRNNLNELDKKAFGIAPFCYISFTTIIAKIAFEKYLKYGGKKKFDDYFKNKIDNVNNEETKAIFKVFKRYIKGKLRIKDDLKKAYITSNKFMINRVYQVALHTALLSGKKNGSGTEFNNKLSKFYKSYYDLLIFTNQFVEDLKNYSKSKGKKYTDAMAVILQDWGDNIRVSGNPFNQYDLIESNKFESLFVLSNEINTLIKTVRFRIRYLDNGFNFIGSKKIEPDCLFVIECFRNPYEVEFFRSRYSEFYLLSISANKSIRKKRVGEYFSEVRDRRDEGKGKKVEDLFKLDVTSCVLLSDIALINNEDGKQEYFSKFLRFFALIRNPGCIPPNDNELYMHIAYSHSLKSTCISRKVGAVILGPRGYILGAGWNDTGDGQIGCGLRTKNDLLTIDSIRLTSNNEDLIKFRELLKNEESEYVCYKDIMSKVYTDKKLANFNDDCPNECIKRISSELGIKRLEYCRALHAEENAILQSAKIGGMPIENGTIYTTTYPCELCAKKLYQIGIRTIYYTEPYPESISEQVFLEDGTKIIERIPFEGVKSNSYFRLFKPVYDKKELSIINRQEQIPQ